MTRSESKRMHCPYCGHDMGYLPIETIRASMIGPRMLAMFDEIVKAGREGISLRKLTHIVYKEINPDVSYNTVKVTMIRLKERIKTHGWTVESGVSQHNTTERVYRFKPIEPVQVVEQPASE